MQEHQVTYKDEGRSVPAEREQPQEQLPIAHAVIQGTEETANLQSHQPHSYLKSKKCRWNYALLLITFMVVGAVVGGVLANREDPSPGPSPPPTLLPTTNMPTRTSPTSEMPSPGATQSPTVTPTIVRSPTVAPTPRPTPIPVPLNSLCANAIPVQYEVTPVGPDSSHEGTVQGDTTGATGDATCNFVVSPGIWYYIGPYETRLSIDACNSFSGARVSVFSGTCDNLSCIDIEGNGISCSLENIFTDGAPSIPEYFVLVHGADEEAAGSVSLTVNYFRIG